jgi:hypothetical protein
MDNSDNSVIHFPVPRTFIEEVARDVFTRLQPATTQIDAEAHDIRVKHERLMAKPFWSIAELAFVWGCSDGHIRNLLQRAEDGATDCPIPFCNIDGLIMFERDVILEWTHVRRPLRPGARKSGGKRNSSHLHEVKKAS